jgi:hypothetical protein
MFIFCDSTFSNVLQPRTTETDVKDLALPPFLPQRRRRFPVEIEKRRLQKAGNTQESPSLYPFELAEAPRPENRHRFAHIAPQCNDLDEKRSALVFEIDKENKIPINRQQPSLSERMGETYRAVLFHIFEKRCVMTFVESRTDPDVRFAPHTAFQQCKEFL